MSFKLQKGYASSVIFIIYRALARTRLELKVFIIDMFYTVMPAPKLEHVTPPLGIQGPEFLIYT